MTDNIIRSTKRFTKVTWATMVCRIGLETVLNTVHRVFHGSCHAPILLYHRVLPSGRKNVYSSPHIIVSLETFEKQMAFLSAHYRVLPLDELTMMLASGQPLPRRCVSVTFDDGWADNFHYAWPVLREYGIPATIYLTTGFIGAHKVFWQERFRFLTRCLNKTMNGSIPNFESILSEMPPKIGQAIPTQPKDSNIEFIVNGMKTLEPAERNEFLERLEESLGNPEFPLADNAFLTWDQVGEMSDFNISFGSHTINHAILTRMAPEEIQSELIGSKALLETKLEIPVNSFAYPNGNYDEKTIDAVKRCGFTSAVTTQNGRNRPGASLLSLRRINISERRFTNFNHDFSMQLFAATLAGLV